MQCCCEFYYYISRMPELWFKPSLALIVAYYCCLHVIINKPSVWNDMSSGVGDRSVCDDGRGRRRPWFARASAMAMHRLHTFPASSAFRHLIACTIITGRKSIGIRENIWIPPSRRQRWANNTWQDIRTTEQEAEKLDKLSSDSTERLHRNPLELD